MNGAGLRGTDPQKRHGRFNVMVQFLVEAPYLFKICRHTQ
jgi:hypothetical protein